MKITFIVPAIGKKPGQKYIGTWKMEPLTIAVLKALTPSGIAVEFFDDRIELIDYSTETDLVVITVETYTAKRSYQIAAEFRRQGVPVVLGGYHVTLVPAEALEQADCIVIGNAETIWPQLIADFKKNHLQNRYAGGIAYSELLPDKTIFADKKYLPVSLVETGRGCCHSCDFCAITSYYQCRYFKRSHRHIITDIERSRNKYHFLVDDNLVADVANAKKLFQAISPLRIKWAGQATLAIAKDRELLALMKKSGCELILIGFESLEAESLRQMNKSWSQALGERDELVRRIHDAGLGIYATFVFGYDSDTRQTFDRTLEFARKHRFYTAAFNHLLPFPGTALYKRLKEEQRLIYDQWWLAEDYHYGELAFHPKGLPATEVSRLCRMARREFAGLPTVIQRGLANMQRTSPLMWPLFWAMNLRLGEEIDEKLKVPIGGNLDELPK